jgi:hypothetical protein
MRCDVTWLPLRGSVALRLAHKIRLQVGEGSRVQRATVANPSIPAAELKG